MRGKTGKQLKVLGTLVAVAVAVALLGAPADSAEYNPLRGHPVAIGPEASRLIVRFRATADNAVVKSIARPQSRIIWTREARSGPGDVERLAARAHVDFAKSRQLTSSMHVVYLPKKLYGAAVDTVLRALRADSAVDVVDVDRLRYPDAIPDDPLFQPSTNATGQWFMLTPSTLTATSDASATDAVSAWDITKGSTGIVVADIDTGVRFDHPDLLRAGLGGRLLPGYDFVAEDANRDTGAALGTFLIANDGDGWDPDPSDPGDWISTADEMNALFPAATCGAPQTGGAVDSSWHGTRVMGVLGALTDNAVGIAGMSWSSYLLPVRALGKCGGYDSDIIAGMQWAAGMSVSGVPDNPFPADIINLSLGATGDCPTTSPYYSLIGTLTSMGVLVVASAGNESGPVDEPGSCPGVLAVAGLRNVGTKVGYSSLGAQVGVAAPAGNCVNSSGACLRSIDTTVNTGLTVPAANSYTDQLNPNLGTSFSAPIVAGIAVLMRAVNANLIPTELIARIKSSATAFPQPAGLPVCPELASDMSGECACPNDGSQCGAGMVNALKAVKAALRPIAAVLLPATTSVGSSAVLDAGGSTAACGHTIASYAWAQSGGVSIQGGAAAAKVSATPTGTAGTLTLTVTDDAGAVDSAILTVGADGSIIAAPTTPSSAGSSANACLTALSVTPAAPTLAASFSPASVAENVVATLTITLQNTNGFALTQSKFAETLPANLSLAAATAAAAAPATTCGGAGVELASTTTGVSLSGANIPANGSCTVSLSVQTATPGSYTNTLAANALATGPAGPNTAAATATLTVTAPSKGGGGELDWWDTLFVVGVILAGRRHAKRRPDARGERGPPRGSR